MGDHGVHSFSEFSVVSIVSAKILQNLNKEILWSQNLDMEF